MNNWQTKKLGEVCDIVMDKPNEFSGTKKYYTTGGINNNGNYKYELVNFETRPGRADLLPKVGDVGFAKMKNTNKVFIINDDLEKSIFSTGFCFLRVKETILPRFLFIFIASDEFQKIKDNLAGEGIMGSIKKSDIGNIEIILPSIGEQKRIVKILDEVFEGVEKAKENAEKNLKNSRELFESYLQNLKGEYSRLGGLIDIKTGKLNSNAMQENGQYPFFTCAREIYAINKYAFDCEAILLAGNNAVGDFNVKHYKGKFNAYQRTYIITVNKDNKILYKYLYYQLLNSLKEFKSNSVGTGTKFLKIGMIENLEIILPSLSEQKAIVKKLDALAAETKKLEVIYKQKLTDLEELKKSVLQKAFIGEL